VSQQRSLHGPGSLTGERQPSGSAAATASRDALGSSLDPDEPLAALAARYGLSPSAQRPPVLAYLRQLWQRRHFIMSFATARNVAMYTEARLGQLWQVLTPLLNAGVYVLIFGALLHTSRGVPNPIAFIVSGVFIFNFTQRSFIIASRVINDSLNLIRALHFPRACLPLGYVLIEFQQLLLSFGVMFVIVVVSGEPITWYWLLIIPLLVLQSLFNVGGGLILARWGAGFDDVSQLLPFLVRTWMYTSGVLFSIQSLRLLASKGLAAHPHLTYLLQINPAAVYITLIRNAVLRSQRLSMAGAQPFNAAKCDLYRYTPTKPHLYLSAYCHPIVSQSDLWLYGVGWAVVALILGFFLFWRAEAMYGRG
jgi:teichoic acid transport system permease protein